MSDGAAGTCGALGAGEDEGVSWAYVRETTEAMKQHAMIVAIPADKASTLTVNLLVLWAASGVRGCHCRTCALVRCRQESDTRVAGGYPTRVVAGGMLRPVGDSRTTFRIAQLSTAGLKKARATRWMNRHPPAQRGFGGVSRGYALACSAYQRGASSCCCCSCCGASHGFSGAGAGEGADSSAICASEIERSASSSAS